MMQQLNMFADMGCPITALSAISGYIQDYWEDVLRDRQQRDPEDDGPEYQSDPDFRKFVEGLFQSWHGGCGGMERYGILGWQFHPDKVVIERTDGSTIDISRVLVMRELRL